MITRTHCTHLVGQHVVFRTHDGIHHGILQSVTDEGIIVRPAGSGNTRLASVMDSSNEAVDLLDNIQQHPDVVQAWFPFFFFPFFALAFLWPWAWWW